MFKIKGDYMDSPIQSIMFVCLGNICRSPLAEFIAKKKISELNLDIDVASSGTASYHEGEGACDLSIAVARKHNIDLTKHRAQQIKQKHLEKYDLFIALDQQNLNDLKKNKFFSENKEKKIKKLGDFGFDGKGVPDPYFVGKIDIVFNMINQAVTNLLKEINKM